MERRKKEDRDEVWLCTSPHPSMPEAVRNFWPGSNIIGAVEPFKLYGDSYGSRTCTTVKTSIEEEQDIASFFPRFVVAKKRRQRHIHAGQLLLEGDAMAGAERGSWTKPSNSVLIVLVIDSLSRRMTRRKHGGAEEI